MWTGGVLACLLLLGASAARAEDAAECKRYEKLQYPAADMPTAAQREALKDCEPSNLYYGIGARPDYVQTRLCAFARNDKGYLMMLYANGQGVARNYGLARKAACETEAAPAETGGRLEHLQSMESGKEGKSPKIDLCDDVTSGMMMGYCAAIQADLTTQEREQKFAQLTGGWSSAQKAAFGQLRKSADAFIEARSGGEVDRSGTARAMFVIEEESKLRADFLRSVQDFEAGRLPAFTLADFLKADRGLNLVYGRLKKSRDAGYPGAVEMSEIRDAQRAWLAYRDAWVTFGKVRYPAVADYVWKAYFTKKRVGMLRELLEGRKT